MDLRPYQIAAVSGARDRIREGSKRVLIVMPTGGGKTVVASEIIRSACERGSRTLFLAHRRELILQTCDKLNRFGVSHGVIMAGIRPAPQRPVQVASVQTLARRPDAMSRVDLVFIDEAHHTTESNAYGKLLKWWPDARVVGLTATPWRLDGQGLADVYDGHVVSTTPRELRDQGFLVPVGGWEYEGIDTSGARVQKGDFVSGDLQKSATSSRVVGDIITEWVAHAGGKRTILFASTVMQSQLMVREFIAAGVPAEHIDGNMGTAERDAVLARLRSGQTLVVCNCNVLTEGFDCPELEVCILARPTLSTSLYLQMVGRVLRLAPGKTMARIHDHAGCLAAHGHPFAERDYSPTLSSKASRKDVEKKEKAEKLCPSCESVRTRWPCDACGYEPTPQELQLEYEEAAAKRAIENDGTAPKKVVETDGQRKEKWRSRYEWDGDFSERRRFFDRMVAKHGPTKGVRVYSWVSGFCERPKPEWVAEIESSGPSTMRLAPNIFSRSIG